MEKNRQGGLLIARIHQSAERVFSRILRTYKIDEINPAQGRILLVLWQEDGISMQELAARTYLGKSTLTSMLDRMEKAGHILRRVCPEDHRKILVSLSDKEDPQRYHFEHLVEEMKDIFYKGFKDDEIDRFEEALTRILQNLSEENQA